MNERMLCVYGICTCVKVACEGRHQVPCSVTLPYSFETGSLTEPGVRLAISKPSGPSPPPHSIGVTYRQAHSLAQVFTKFLGSKYLYGKFFYPLSHLSSSRIHIVETLNLKCHIVAQISCSSSYSCHV